MIFRPRKVKSGKISGVKPVNTAVIKQAPSALA
jgi:hypothetical protein